MAGRDELAPGVEDDWVEKWEVWEEDVDARHGSGTGSSESKRSSSYPEYGRGGEDVMLSGMLWGAGGREGPSTRVADLAAHPFGGFEARSTRWRRANRSDDPNKSAEILHDPKLCSDVAPLEGGPPLLKRSDANA